MPLFFPSFYISVISVIWLNVLLRSCLSLDSGVCLMLFSLESISLWHKHIWLLQNYEWVEKIKVPVLTVSDFILSPESIPTFPIQKKAKPLQSLIFRNLTFKLHMNVYHLSFEGFSLPGSRPVLFTWVRWRRTWSKLGKFLCFDPFPTGFNQIRLLCRLSKFLLSSASAFNLTHTNKQTNNVLKATLHRMWASFRGGRLDACWSWLVCRCGGSGSAWVCLLGVAVWKSCRSLLEAVDIVSVPCVFGASRWFYAAGATPKISLLNFWRLLSAEPWLLNQLCVWGERTWVLKRTFKVTSEAGLNVFSVWRHPGALDQLRAKKKKCWRCKRMRKKMKMRHKWGKAK